MRIRHVALVVAIFFGLGTPLAAAPLKETISEVSSKFSDTLSKRGARTVAIYSFTELNGYQSALGDYLAEEILTSLVGRGEYRVIERRELDRILQEHGLYGKDLFDPQTLPSLKKLKGIDMMVTGSITKLGAKVRVNARILEISTATIVGAHSITIDRDDDVNTLLGESAKSVSAGQSKMPEGLVAQPADVGFKGRYFEVAVTGARVSQGGRKISVIGQFKSTATKPMRFQSWSNKANAIIAQTDTGEVFGEDRRSARNRLRGFSDEWNGTLIQPNETFLISWELERPGETHGAKLSIRSRFSVQDVDVRDYIETPIVINDIRLR